jgi:asparagine synthase (glutamine-hydrolysing)
MCGIVGFIDQAQQSDLATLETTVTCMSDRLHHRGPDSGGVWADAAAGVALGHRRLAIIDLSPQGHQPMHATNGRFVLVFNGEIYNFGALRSELHSLGHTFRGTSDTEVMLAAFSQWGIHVALARFVGMFSFAVWDRNERVLTLARDRLGEKPLYYGWMGHTFLFGSELKALRAHPAWCPSIDRDALALLVCYNYIPAPSSIYTTIRKLPPAALLSLPLADTTPGTLPNPLPYWSARRAAEEGIAQPFSGSDAEAIAHMDTLLREVVAGQMVADVPLGAFLSGGIDSSLIVALMQTQSTRPVRTFTIGFHEKIYDEAAYAKAIAHHLGTDHTELYVTPDDALAVIPRLPALYDEPFADSSQIPTFLVAEMTGRHVTVSLSGDGGDELFGGYHRYSYALDIWSKFGWLPTAARYALARAILMVPVPLFNAAFSWLAPLLVRDNNPAPIGTRFHRLADILQAGSAEQMYLRMLSYWQEPDMLVPGARGVPLPLHQAAHEARQIPDLSRRMMYIDTVTYLPDDIMVKVDRAAMGVSLETRAPLLDHRVFEYAWSLPLVMRMRSGQSKWILRQVLDRYVPHPLVERRKMGFGVPVAAWLRGPLREWAEELLSAQQLQQEGFFFAPLVRQVWEQHLAGIHDWTYHLWSILMFQAWLEQERRVN